MVERDNSILTHAGAPFDLSAFYFQKELAFMGLKRKKSVLFVLGLRSVAIQNQRKVLGETQHISVCLKLQIKGYEETC